MINRLKSCLGKVLFIARLKAFITDIFMINMPILYFTTYIVIGSKEAFRENEVALFICFIIYCFVINVLLYKKSQTLGYMYSNIKLVHIDGKKLGFLLLIFRYLAFCFSMVFVFGLVFPLMQKDSLAFHDYVCKTKVIKSIEN